jgi:hypothetical protein
VRQPLEDFDQVVFGIEALGTAVGRRVGEAAGVPVEVAGALGDIALGPEAAFTGGAVAGIKVVSLGVSSA